MTLTFPRSIGDGYPEYVDDELGYNYHASEVISASESRRHEQIKRTDGDDLDELRQRLTPLSDLERWAFARRCLQRRDLTEYVGYVETIIDGELAHPALHYPEIFVDLARKQAGIDALDQADAVIDRIEQTWPEFAEAIPLLRAQILLFAGRIDEADAAYREALASHEDVDLLIETAEDFHRADADDNDDKARQWLQQAEDLAHKTDDNASTVDIELLRQRLSDPVSVEAPNEAAHPPDDSAPDES